MAEIWVRATVVLGLALCVVCTESAPAADWQLNPRVSLTGDYNDNINLADVNADRISVVGTGLDAQVELVVDGPRTQFKITPEVQENYYPARTEADSNNELLGLFFQEQGLTYTAGVNGNFASRLLVYAGLPTTAIVGDLGQPQQGAVLNSTEGFRQNLLTLYPYFNWQLTPRTHLIANAGFVDSTFNVQQIGFVNSSDIQGSAGVAFDVEPTATLSLTGDASRFRPDTGFSADTYGGHAEWDGHFSQNQQYYIRVGGDRTSISPVASQVAGSAPSVDVSSIAAGAGVHWTLQVSEIFVDATRSVAPAGGGYAVNEDQLRLAANRRFTQKFAMFVGVRGIRYTPLDNAIEAVPTQTYFVGRTGFEWRMRRWLALVGSYSYTNYKNTGETTPAPATAVNQVSLSIVYEPNRPENGPAITVGY
jgi:hypothetical protein